MTYDNSPTEKNMPWLEIYGSMILLSVQVGDLWQLVKEEHSLTWNMWIGDTVIDPMR